MSKNLYLGNEGKFDLLGNDWVQIRHEDGYDYYIKTEYFNNEPISVLVDNFSVSPLGLYGYDINSLKLTPGWEELYSNKIVSSKEYDLSILKGFISETLITEVEKLLYSEELIDVE
jgi:hypothetical protein